MAFEIKPLLKADCVSLAKLYYRAFEHSIAAVLFSAPPSESSYELMGAQRAALISKPNIHAYKAVDPDTGHMIGAAYFMVEPEGVSQESLEDPSPMFTEFAPEQKVGLWKAWAATMQAGYKKTIGTTPAVEVLMLLVEPAWQGKGVGSALLKIGCDEADRYANDFHPLEILHANCRQE